ncbi:hypothetical protein GCM10009764_06840 [Nocardia ninae]|uniref:Uncharacterized protein n=1 Tax=Nocardia ninae NBRC 108245 TaxID=1210091 RepID=A0A511MW06_9NOCA|nr:hypothetical protein NN4_88150 [Nocardia ninae NBRC 108245]
MHPDVVADVHDRGDIGIGQQFPDALEEAGAADTPDQYGNPRAAEGVAVRLKGSHIRTAYALSDRAMFGL